MRSTYTHIQILENNLSIISLAYHMQSIVPLVIYFKLRLCVLCFCFVFYIRWGRDIYIYVCVCVCLYIYMGGWNVSVGDS